MPDRRSRQTCCQFEPAYPDHATVVFSMRFPNLTAHQPSDRCAIGAPHEIAECGEWQDDA